MDMYVIEISLNKSLIVRVCMCVCVCAYEVKNEI